MLITNSIRRITMVSSYHLKHVIRGRESRLIVLILLAVLSIACTARADVITDWNQTALNTTNAIGLPFPQQTRAMAMVHAAMFDAVNSIDHRFSPYAIRISPPSGASPEAAAAAAAHRVLLILAPT